ncbi:MAG: hypothetical protein KF872_00625 [Chitinophagales bacterium]|nr:hypothetical protein [Chitinophagales bacterium]
MIQLFQTVTKRLKAIHISTLLVAWIAMSSAVCKAQVTVSLVPDSNHIVIGDFLGVKFAAKYPTSAQVQFPMFKDSLGSLDIISIGKKDTAAIGSEIIVSQQLTLSAYDSGVYTVAPIAVLFTQNGIADSAFTEAFEIAVATVPVDTAQNFKPIKGPLEVKRNWKEFLPYILVGLAIIALGLLGWWLFKKYYKPKGKTEEEINRPKVAHVWALKELQKLEQEKLWQSADAKAYYSRLTDIFRKYLEYRFNLQALESTTDEIELMLRTDDISTEARIEIVEVLKQADLVKFAKQLPLPEQSKNALYTTREFVKTTAWKEEDIRKQSTNQTKK